MHNKREPFYVDVADYSGNIKCSLYDSMSDLSGQAEDVNVTFERNGWKELNFTIPSVCYNDENELEPNYRLDYIIADYHLRTVSSDGTDWFIINETGVSHDAFSKKTTVTAPHISQRLKTKALDLEFSIDEGNNVGTADEFLKTILEYTDWEPGRVAKFYEDDGVTIKVRSMTAPKKTGALKLIQDMCELFEAKPVFYVDENGAKKVDILPMNPFSKLKEGEMPDAVLPTADKEKYLVDSNVIELHFDKAVKKLERRINAENVCTRLYGYGSYGDNVSKYCSLQTAFHEEYSYTVPNNYTDAEFSVTDSNGAVRYFTASVSKNDGLVWSMLDFNSRSYVWNETKRVAYEVYLEPKTNNIIPLTGEKTDIQNYVPFLSDYTYYRKVGLLSNEMFQEVAKYQRDTISYYQDIIEKQSRISDLEEQLSKIGVPMSGFLRLDISSCENTPNGAVFTINWSDEYPDGVLYRSDYLEKDIHYFGWHVAQDLKPNGQPVSGVASVIMVLHDNGTHPVKWQKSYLKDIDGRTYQDAEGHTYHSDYSYATSEGERPRVVTVWDDIEFAAGDQVYLFCVDGFTSGLGNKFSTDEAITQELDAATRIGNSYHPTYFENKNVFPDINFSSYGWLYQYDVDDYDTPGELFFCWAERGDAAAAENVNKWKKVFVGYNTPAVTDGAYFYNTKTCVLWHAEAGQWVKLETAEEKILAQHFGVVYMMCRQRDEVYKGLYEKYCYKATSDMPAGYYALPSDFGFYWLFSTKDSIPRNRIIKLDTTSNQMKIGEKADDIATVSTYLFNTLAFPSKNDLEDALFVEGSVYFGLNEGNKNGNEYQSDRTYRSNFIPVWPNDTYQYKMPAGVTAVLYDSNRNYLGYRTLTSGTHTFSTSVDVEYDDAVNPENLAGFKQTRYVKLILPKSTGSIDTIKSIYWLRLNGYQNYCFTNDIKYRILTPVTHEGAPIGINYLIKRFRDVNNELYLDALPALNAAQQTLTDANSNQIKLLGDILREGWWQDNSYVAGDEQRMYKDALDNLENIAQPEVTYTFDYLHMFGANEDLEFENSKYDVEWPDIKVTDAAHLVDPELDVNQWAYIDKFVKYYDNVWKSNLEINTKLSLIGQHDFKDVMTRIAEVASETKAKQTLYSRAGIVSSDGTVDGSNISGEINTQDVVVTGGASGWKTDSKGNMIMESSDGLAAMKFSGNGLAISNTKDESGEWEWEPVGNGYGLRADAIRFGTMKGERIEAGTISADRLMANVGNTLEIGSNKALALFATVDGTRPVDKLKTTDAVIEINAGEIDELSEWQRYTEYKYGDGVLYLNKKYRCIEPHTSGDSIEMSKWKEYDGTTPASINIGSGGAINLIASNDGKEDPSINLVSGGSINAIAGGEINIAAGGSINIASGGEFTLGANSIVLDAQEKCKVGGWYIGQNHIGTSDDISNSSVGLKVPDEDSETNDVVIWAGDADAQKAPFRVYADGKMEASDIVIKSGEEGLIKMAGDIQFLNKVMITGSVITGNSISGGEIKDTQITDGTMIGNMKVEKDILSCDNGLSINTIHASDNKVINVRNIEADDDTVSVYDDGLIKCNSLRTESYSVPSEPTKVANTTPLVHKEAFDNLTPYSFTYGNSTEKHFGFMLEDMSYLYPEICRSDLSISYIDLVAVLVKEVQDLRTRASSLENRVDELNRRVSELEDNDA